LFVATGLQVEAKFALLEIELNKAVFKKDTLAKQAKDCEDKLIRAGKLIVPKSKNPKIKNKNLQH
jgi:hypothetical protein